MKKCFSIIISALMMLSSFGYSASASTDIVIKPDVDSNVGTISPLLYGSGFEFNAGMIKAKLNDPAMTKLFIEDGVKLIRFSNGTSALHYMWHNPESSYGSGNGGIPDPNGVYPAPRKTPEEGHSLHTDEVVQFCKTIGAELVLQVNTYNYWDFASGGTKRITFSNLEQGAQYAADWVEYCNALNDGSNINGGTDWAAERAKRGHNEPYNIKYWEIGNEDWVYFTPAECRKMSDAFAAAIRKVDPTVNVIYQGHTSFDGFSHSIVNNVSAEWHQKLLEVKDQNADFISSHSYFGSKELLLEEFSTGTKRWETSSLGWKLLNPLTDTRFLQGTIKNTRSYAWVKGLPNLTNYSFQAVIKNRNYDSSSLGNAGFLFNRKDDYNYNIAYISQDNGKTKLCLSQIVDGAEQVLSSYVIADSVNLNDDYYMKVETKDDRIRVNAWKTSEGDRPAYLIDVPDNTPNKFGYVGVITMENSTASFDSFKVMDLGNTLYDNFDSPKVLPRWTTVNGEWGITADSNSKLSQSGTSGTNALAYIDSIENYSDMDSRVQISNRGGSGDAGIAFGITDSSNYYLAYINDNCINVDKVVGGAQSRLGSYALPTNLQGDIWFKVRTNVYGDNTKVQVKAWKDTYGTGTSEPDWQMNYELIGEKVIGKVGLVSGENATAVFDNFAVTRTVRYNDYFEADNGNWTKNNGTWEYSDGRLRQSEKTDAPTLSYLAGFDDATTYTAKVKLFDRDYAEGSLGRAGMAFNITNGGENYYITYIDSPTRLVLAKVTDGINITEIGQYTFKNPINTSTPIYLKVNMNQGLAAITLWRLPDKEASPQLRVALNIVDKDFISSGKLGVGTLDGSTVSFDDLEFIRNDEQSIADVKSSSGEILTDLRLDQTNEYIASTKTNAKIFESEFNHLEADDDGRYYYLQNYAHAALIADYIGDMINSGVAMASMHTSMGPDMFRMYDPYTYGATLETTRTQTSTLAFRMFSRYFGDTRITADITNMQKYPYTGFDKALDKLVTTDIDMVGVYSSKDTKTNTLRLIFVNKDTENDKEMKIDLSDKKRTKTQGIIRELGENNDISEGNMRSTDTVQIKESAFDTSGNVISVKLPAHTIMAVEVPLD